jgi:hypothetical protein
MKGHALLGIEVSSSVAVSVVPPASVSFFPGAYMQNIQHEALAWTVQAPSRTFFELLMDNKVTLQNKAEECTSEGFQSCCPRQASVES